jgi:hypothetical protein
MNPEAIANRVANRVLIGKELSKMTPSEINKALDKNAKESSKLMDEMIEVGRGHEKPSETLTKRDELSVRLQKNWDRQHELRDEVLRRHGPNAPYRLPVR